MYVTWRTARSRNDIVYITFASDISSAVRSAISATAALVLSTPLNFVHKTINYFTMFHAPRNQVKAGLGFKWPSGNAPFTG